MLELIRPNVFIAYGFYVGDKDAELRWYFGRVVEIYKTKRKSVSCRINFNDGESGIYELQRENYRKKTSEGWMFISELAYKKEQYASIEMNLIEDIPQPTNMTTDETTQNEIENDGDDEDIPLAKRAKRPREINSTKEDNEENNTNITMTILESKMKDLSLSNSIIIQRMDDMNKNMARFQTILMQIKGEKDGWKSALRCAELQRLLDVFKIEARYPTNLSTDILKHILPSAVLGNKKIPYGWNKIVCSNYFQIIGEKPVCKSLKKYTLIKNEDGTESLKKVKEEEEKNVEDYYWVPDTNKSSTPGYGIVITRSFRKETSANAKSHCQEYKFCTPCMNAMKPFVGQHAFIPAGKHHKFCELCCEWKTITTTEGAKEKRIDICKECNTHLNKANDNITFAMDKLSYLFPEYIIDYSVKSFGGLTPDTCLECAGVGMTSKIYILLEQDTCKHSSMSRESETNKKYKIAKTIYNNHPNAYVFIIRYDPSSEFKGRDGQKKSYTLTTGERLIVVRQWVIWYLATLSLKQIPQFLVLYLWYDYGSTKMLHAASKFGSSYIGHSFGYPVEGVWKFYGYRPQETEAFKNIDYLATSCRGESISEVFPGYHSFSELNKMPDCFKI